MQDLITISGVSKRYGNYMALDSINLSIKKGQIYGFIGENGAGKTTLIRLIAGLSEPTSGEIRLDGEVLDKNNSAARSKMGFMVERPIYHDNLTAEENIQAQLFLNGKEDYSKVKQLLEKVGLKNYENKKVKDFSLGMRQRVGIAMALANDPEIIILDEPVNGLDPVGMVEVREILRKLNQEENITIFLSSHILPELYQLAIDYIIIHKGQIKETISLEELNKKITKYISINTSNNAKLVEILKNKMISGYIEVENGLIRVKESDLTHEEIGQIAFDNDIVIKELTEKGETLENYYLSLLGGKNA